MIDKFKRSIRAKVTITFISILFISCIISFILIHVSQRSFVKPIIEAIVSKYNTEQVQQIHQKSILIMIALIFCIIIGSILMFFATKRISKPIKYISDVTKEVSKGNFDISINYENDDEIGVLAKNFNTMIKELKNMEYLRKDFISNVSHEFKTPIASIQGFVELLKNNEVSQDKKEEYINIIIDETERLSKLTSNMLKISRLDNQVIPNKQEEFSLDEQIRKIVLLLQDKWEEKEIGLNINLEDTKFYGDKELIEQIWINIIENAIKFSNFKGEISINLKNFKNYIVIEVCDNGIGMSKEVQKRVFEKFYQGDNSRAREGSGLGLSIVKRIIDIYKGDIEIESNIGVGTKFKVILNKISSDL